jgi:NAD-dependent DNA ligase
MKDFLDKASEAYYNGSPIISDAQFDKLAESCNYNAVGAKPSGNLQKHLFPMYSLDKYYEGEGKEPLSEYPEQHKVRTPKLDGAAISLLYVGGNLVRALTRGDGIEGTDITEKFLYTNIVPISFESNYMGQMTQITGEIVAPKTIENSRNYASGALNLKSLEEFKSRELFFVAYGVAYDSNSPAEFWTTDMEHLHSLGFNAVYWASDIFLDKFPHDGVVVRLAQYSEFNKLGYTSKHPRGAYAIKTRAEAIETTLLDVVWQVGKSGKVTPVAILEPVMVGDAEVSRATLNNGAYIKALGLYIGCTVGIIRAGEIIPQVVYMAE